MLETVSTVFRGVGYAEGDVTGKYFNKIVGDLMRLHWGQTLNQVLGWLEYAHGYLSVPDGGGVRYGAELRSNIETTEGEARLYCDLTRSYINYLLHEHANLGQPWP